jgi:outer membrane protein OmpU
MNKFKKIGLTALAGSLVATTAYAGAVSVAGGASMGVKNNSGTDGGKSWTMGNQLTFTGGGELDNGLNVSVSFVLDQGDNGLSATANATTANAGAPFDSHSITISSDSLGSINMAGEGGSSAQSALSAQVSYSASGAGKESSTAIGLTYTGVEGLSVSYGTGELSTRTANASGDATTMKASYAMGSFTAAYSNTEVDYDGTGSDEEVSSFKLSYTVTDDLSVTYGEETHEKDGEAVDEEYESISASYTTGGMTVTAASIDASGTNHTAGDKERWKLGVSFAF